MTDYCFLKLSATVKKLTERFKSIKYIASVEIQNDSIIVLYSDGREIKLALPSISHITQTINAEELHKSLKQDTSSIVVNVEHKVTDLSNKLADIGLKDFSDIEIKKFRDSLEAIIIERLTEELKKLFNELPQIESGKDGRDGVDGKDANEEAILKQLTELIECKLIDVQTLLANELKISLESAIKLLPVPKDGIDGQDGKDADAEDIIKMLTEHFNSLIIETNNSLRKELLELTIWEIQKIQDSFKPIKGDKGDPGEKGADADEKKITDTLFKQVSIGLSKSKQLIKAEIKHGLDVLKESIPEVKDGKDGRDGVDGKDGTSIKGDQGDRGERGNGIIDVEIDSRDHLIVKTEDKVIDAGEIRSKRVFYGGGGGFSYTNTLPMPFDVGGYRQGTRFDKVEERVFITKLLYGFDLPEFSMFEIEGIPQNVEIGYEILAGNYNVNFTINNPELLKEDSITITSNGTELLSNLPNLSPVVLSLPEYKLDSLGAVSFQIYAYDTTGVSFLRDYICNFKYRIYYGEYTEDIEDTGLVNPLAILRATELIDDIKAEYLFLAVGYKWFCYPQVLGEHYTFFEVTSDIALVFTDVKQIEITNEYGLTLTYNCYRTEHEINEEFVIGVKNG